MRAVTVTMVVIRLDRRAGPRSSRRSNGPCCSRATSPRRDAKWRLQSPSSSIPAATPGPHTHFGEEVGYVIEGTFLIEQAGEAGRHAAGRRLVPDSRGRGAQRDERGHGQGPDPRDVHRGKRKAAGDAREVAGAANAVPSRCRFINSIASINAWMSRRTRSPCRSSYVRYSSVRCSVMRGHARPAGLSSTRSDARSTSSYSGASVRLPLALLPGRQQCDRSLSSPFVASVLSSSSSRGLAEPAQSCQGRRSIFSEMRRDHHVVHRPNLLGKAAARGRAF